MTRLTRSMLLATLTAVLPAIGCEDSAAKARQTAHVSISKATTDYQAALSKAFDPANSEARSQLQAVISSMGGLSEAAPGQQAAASALSSSAHHQLGTMDLVQAERLEAMQRQARSVVRGAARQSRDLQALAAAQASHDDAALRQQLEQHHAAAAQQLATFSQQLQQLSAPIAQLNTAISAETDQVNALRSQYNELYGRAQEHGPMDGFPMLEQAIAKLRAAQEIEKRISDKQAELEYSVGAEQQMAQTRSTQLQSLLEQIQAARADLERITQAVGGEVRTTQEHVAQFNRQITEQAAQVKAAISGELAGLYDGAASHFQAAAQAANRGGGNAVNAALAQQALAHVHWSRARAHSDHASMLAEMAQLQGMEGSAAESKAAQSAAEAAAREAVAALNEAKSSLEQSAGDADAQMLNSLRANIDAAIAAMQSANIDWLSIASATPLPTAAPAESPVTDPPATTETGADDDTSDK